MFTDLNMYSGKNSIYESMKSWASSIYPSTNHKWDATSDSVSNILLNVMMGRPLNQGFTLRIFNKFIACDILYNHLMGNQVTIQQARRVYNNDAEIWHVCGQKALPAH
jgi:hypothetical protein